MLNCKVGKMIATYFAAYICSVIVSLQTLDSSLNYIYQAQIWYQDHLGFPITARPYGSFGLEKMEIADVLTQMIQRACFYNPTTTMSTTVTTATTAFRAKMKTSTSETVEDEIAESLDEVVKEPVVSSAASYPNLVSTYLLKCNKYRQNEPVQIEK